MTRRSTPRLTVALAITVAAAVVAVLTGRPETALFATPWFVLAALGLAASRPLRPRASVTAGPRALAGDDVAIEVTVRGPTTGLLTLTPKHEAGYRPDPLGTATASQDGRPMTVVSVIDPGGASRVRCSLPPAEWGTHDVGTVQVKIDQPFGLMQWHGTIDDPTLVRVHPRPEQLRAILAPRRLRRRPGAHLSAAIDRGVDYADLRPFTTGDSHRDINWRASARAGDLWVSQRHPERSADVVLLLDSLIEPGHDARATVGVAIEAAMALTDRHLAVTDRIGFVELGGVVRWVSPGSGAIHRQRLADALLATRLRPNAAERDLGRVPPPVLPARSLVVALSPMFDERFVDALITLRGTGHDVAVVETLPRSAGLDPDDGHSRAEVLARRVWWAERAMLIDRLGGHGIAVGRWRQGQPLEPVIDDITRRLTASGHRWRR